MSYLYLGQPYSHDDPAVMKRRYLEGERVTAELMRAGRTVYAPIVHFHQMALRHDLPTSHDFWLAHNFAMLRKADALVVLKLDGWQQSRGLSAEIDLASAAGITTYLFDPDDDPDDLYR